MSRSSLARQEKMRQKGKLQQAPVVEEVKDRKNMVDMECDINFNINALLIENIKSSRYFQSLNEVTEVHAVVDQIYYKATNAEPWMPGAARSPSPFFCLLYKLLLLKVTGKQMRMLLDHVDSPYIRATGFVYLRYTCPAAQLWDWIEPYINDTEEFSPGHNTNAKTTMGAYVQSLISEQKYSSTIFPRIPQTLQRQLMIKILRKKEEAERAEKNKELVGRVVVGMKLRAVYSADQQWYDARVDVVNDADGTFTVTFLPEDEYGNQEVVNVGQMDLSASLGGGGGVASTAAASGRGDRKTSSSRHKSRSVSRSRGGGDRKTRHKSRSVSRSRSPVARRDSRRRSDDDRSSRRRRSPSRSNSRSRRTSSSRHDSTKHRRRSPSPRRGGSSSRRGNSRSPSRTSSSRRDNTKQRGGSSGRRGNSRSPSRGKGRRDHRARDGHSRSPSRSKGRRDQDHGARDGRDREGRGDRERRRDRDGRDRGGRDRGRDDRDRRDRRHGGGRSRDRNDRSSRDRVRERGGSRRRHASRSVSPRRRRGEEVKASVASVGADVRATDDELLQRVLEKERNKHATSGRNYAKGHIGGIRASMALDYGFNLNAGDNNLDVGIGSGSRSVNDVASKAKRRQEDDARTKRETDERNGKRQAGLDRLKQIYGDASAVVQAKEDE